MQLAATTALFLYEMGKTEPHMLDSFSTVESSSTPASLWTPRRSMLFIFLTSRDRCLLIPFRLWYQFQRWARSLRVPKQREPLDLSKKQEPQHFLVMARATCNFSHLRSWDPPVWGTPSSSYQNSTMSRRLRMGPNSLSLQQPVKKREDIREKGRPRGIFGFIKKLDQNLPKNSNFRQIGQN